MDAINCLEGQKISNVLHRGGNRSNTMHHEFRIASLQPRTFHGRRESRPEKGRVKKKLSHDVFCSSPEGYLCLPLTSESCWDECMFYGSFLGDHLCRPVFDIRGLELFVGVSRVTGKVAACLEC